MRPSESEPRVDAGSLAALEVIVLDHGAPAAELEVGLSIRSGFRVRELGSGTTSAEGRVGFADLPVAVPLTVRLKLPASLADEIREDRARELDEPALWLVPGESRVVTWDLADLPRGIEGMVLDPDGGPVAGLWLRVGRDSGAEKGHPDSVLIQDRNHFVEFSDEHFLQTDSGGRYRLPGLERGSWWIGPTPAGLVYSSPVNERVAPFLHRLVVPETPTPWRHDVTVYFGLFISGQALGPQRESIRTSVALPRGMSAPTDERGRFQLGPLEPGEYELSASPSGYALRAPVRARAGDEGVELRFLPQR